MTDNVIQLNDVRRARRLEQAKRAEMSFKNSLLKLNAQQLHAAKVDLARGLMKEPNNITIAARYQMLLEVEAG